MAQPWQDVFPAVTTQFHSDGSLDLDLTAAHIQILIDSGIAGLVMLGSLGENNALSREEKLEVIRLAVSVSAGRIPVVSGVSEYNSTMGADYVRAAERAGADGFMVMPAMVYHTDREETIHHYRTIAAASTTPIIIYNNPIGYRVDVTPDVLSELASEEKFVAIKESCGDTRRITDIFNAVGDRYTIFGGVDDLIFEAVGLGAKGWIAGVGLAFPAENQRLWDLMKAGNWEEALTLYRWFIPLLHLDVGSKFVQNIKLLLQEVGLGKETVRSPRMVLAGAERESVLGVIRAGLASRPAY